MSDGCRVREADDATAAGRGGSLHPQGRAFARWKARNGKTLTAPLTAGKDGADRIVTESPFHVAKYRDGSGSCASCSTGCRDETAARQWLANVERRAERVTAGMMTPAEDRMADHLALPLEAAFAGFDAHLRGKGTSEIHRQYTARYLRRLAGECAFRTLGDLRRDALERWPPGRMRAWPRRRGTPIAGRWSTSATGAWRMVGSPATRSTPSPWRTSRRTARVHRAMTKPELVKLLDVARERPLIEATTVRKGPRRGEPYADVAPRCGNAWTCSGGNGR